MMRGPRMTKNQKIYLVNYLERNKDLVFYNSGNKPEMDKELKWRDLARGLNSSSLGPSKTTVQWKDTFKDFRTSIRRKSKMLQMKTNADIKVSNAELRFMRLMKLYTPLPGSRSARYSVPNSPKEEDDVGCVKLEGVTFDSIDGNDPMSDDDPLIHGETETNENDKTNNENGPRKKNNMSQKEFINWQRNKIEGRLNFNANTSLAIEIENHALQIQKLASSFDKQAEALTGLAQSFEKVASAIDNIADKFVHYFQR